MALRGNIRKGNLISLQYIDESWTLANSSAAFYISPVEAWTGQLLLDDKSMIAITFSILSRVRKPIVNGVGREYVSTNYDN